MDRLKILNIAGWYPSKENPVNGIFVQEHILAASLYTDVAVLYSEGIDNSINGLYKIEDFYENGIRTLRIWHRKLPFPKSSFLATVVSIYAAYKKLLEEDWRPDLIHAHVYFAGFIAAMLKKIYNVPLVITEHSTQFPRKLLKGLDKFKAKYAFKHADLVCPVSDELRKSIESYGIYAKYYVVPNVVNTVIFSPNNYLQTSKCYKKRLLVVALLDPKKGIPYLLEALVYLKKERDDFMLDIIGDGPYRNEYENMVVNYGLSDYVCFHGLKNKEEVANFMLMADLFVLPSIFETFSVVTAEALATGTPVLVTRCGGPETFVSDDVGLVVDKESAKALLNGLNYLLDNLTRYSASKISKYANSLFSPEVVGLKLHCIYSDVINASKKY